MAEKPVIEETVKYPPILAPVMGPALNPADFAHKKSTVTMVFEKDVLFSPNHGTRVHYTKGVHEVPAEFANHWYLRAHDARIYNKPIAVSEAPASVSAPKASGRGKKKAASTDDSAQDPGTENTDDSE